MDPDSSGFGVLDEPDHRRVARTSFLVPERRREALRRRHLAQPRRQVGFDYCRSFEPGSTAFRSYRLAGAEHRGNGLPWREPPELKERTINRVCMFLKAHQPVTASR